MDGRGGCCIAQYAGGAYDMSKVDRIMLKFRPIAPKPTAGAAVSGSSTAESNVDSVYKTGRSKRRYVRDNNNNNNKRCSRKRRVFSEEKKDDVSEDTHSVVTLLPLLPEMPDPKKEPPVRNGHSPPSDLHLKPTKSTIQHPPPIWLNFNDNDNNNNNNNNGAVGVERKVLMPPAQPVLPVGSFVTVERVTEGYVDGGGGEEGLGYTDEERRMNLERDTCPGFISDGGNRVKWTNEAYRRMIGEGESDYYHHQMVLLATKERLPWSYTAFACRVRLQYTCREEKHSLTVPCDVWRMDSGGFAWRLDVKAALSLGR